ncbi:DNA-cytosine methyltransferase [Brachybacterium faecium]|nr:DNA-cytosine methyltransferase [Brachybacterium faecium]
MKEVHNLDKYKVASLFAGVGGIELGFELTNRFKTVFANEIDKKAAITYQTNFKNKLLVEDIRNVTPDMIPKIDVLTAGFPCTSFSIAGYRKGFEDENTGDLFFETLRLIVAKKPQVVFLENVKNLVSHDKGNTFKIIRESLEENGYHIKYKVLNASEYGNIPQNRERIYIVGFKNIEYYKNFEFPAPVDLKKKLKDVIDFTNLVDERYYYTPEKYNIYDELNKNIVKDTTIYQWRRKYVRENKSSLSPTLTANMGTGGHNVPLILSKHGIRKLTNRECFNLQGYPISYKLPEELAAGNLYKQAGNSVVVTVIEKIAINIYKALNDEVCL